MPMYETALDIARREEEARRQVLAARQAGDTSPLDPVLFPSQVFNPDGSRKRGKPDAAYPIGPPLLTKAEKRADFELRDARACFR